MLHLQVNDKRYIFRIPPPPPKKKKISQISNAKKAVFFLSPEVPTYRAHKQKCLTKNSRHDPLFITTLDGHFKTPLIVLFLMLHFSGLVLMGINWQIPPSARRDKCILFLQIHCMVYLRYVIKDILKSNKWRHVSQCLGFYTRWKNGVKNVLACSTITFYFQKHSPHRMKCTSSLFNNRKTE